MSTIARRIAPLATVRPKRSTAVDRLWRGLLFRSLRSLRGGILEIRDTDGVHTFGDEGEPQVIVVNDPAFYRQTALGGSLGAAGAYIAGSWSGPDLPGMLRIFARNLSTSDAVERGTARAKSAVATLAHRVRGNTRRGSRRNIADHYDLGNELFELFLDATMTYSCGVFEAPEATMLDASIEKLDRICRKLELTPDQHVVEIGSGWGSFALHAAKNYGCRVTTTTISAAQLEVARRRVWEAGLDDRVTVFESDYRDLEGRFDRLVSIEMIEAVGHEHLPAYFQTCDRLLTDDGRACIQAILTPDARYEQYRRSSDFIRHYVFPGSCVPSRAAIRAAMAPTSLEVAGEEDITAHYVTTLQRWREVFLRELPAVRRLGYDDRFIRLWDFYLSYCEAGFAEKTVGTSQFLLHKPGPDASP